MNQVRRTLTGGSLLLTLTALLAGLPPARAYSLTVIPPRIELAVKPGRKVTGTILVAGVFDRPARIRTTFGDWRLEPDGDVLLLLPGSQPRSLARWLSVQPAEFLLSRERKQVIRYEMRVPKDVTGSYWGILFFETVPAEKVKDNTLAVKTAVRLATVIYASTERGGVRDGRLTELSAVYLNGRLTMAASFVNNGNLVVYPTGRFELKNQATGKVQVKVVFNRLTVLPGGTRDLTVDWRGALPPGEYTPSLFVEYGRQISRQGPAIKAGG